LPPPAGRRNTKMEGSRSNVPLSMEAIRVTFLNSKRRVSLAEKDPKERHKKTWGKGRNNADPER